MSLCGLLTCRPDLVVVRVGEIVSACLSSVAGLGAGFSTTSGCLVLTGESRGWVLMGGALVLGVMGESFGTERICLLFLL